MTKVRTSRWGTICRRSLPGVFAVSVLAASPLDVSAATYHVATNGSDSRSCSEARNAGTPKRTIGSALSCLGAGDTLYLRGGTYNERIDSNAQSIPVGSSWQSPVTIASYPGEQATLRYGAGVVNLAASYIQYLVFDRLIFDAARAGSCPSNDGCGVAVISIWGGANHIRIQNSEITGSVGQGVTIFPGNGHSSDYNELIRNRIHSNGTSDFDHGIYLSVNNTVIDGNEIYNNAGWGVHKYPSGNNNVVRNNLIHHNARAGSRGDGIYLQGGSGNRVYNNVVWANNNGVASARETGASIYNNTIAGNRGSGIWLNGGSNTGIRNNIIYDNRSGQLAVYNGATYGMSDNLCGSSGSGCAVGNPRFADPSGGNYRLQPDSPAIDAGATLSMVSTDADGTPRPFGSGYDIGAYEAAPTTAVPAPPTNVRIVR